MFIRNGFRRQSGVTLIEQIVFIIVVSVGVIGVLSTMGPSLRYSADPQLRKQQLAIAESLLSEILHQPFTYCDPDDPAAISATSTAGCSSGLSQDNVTSATPAGESRFGSAGLVFDNVADYAEYSQTGVTGLSGASVANFTAKVKISRAGTGFGLSDDGAALKIDVTVSHPSLDPFTLSGYRFRYAPTY